MKKRFIIPALPVLLTSGSAFAITVSNNLFNVGLDHVNPIREPGVLLFLGVGLIVFAEIYKNNKLKRKNER